MTPPKYSFLLPGVHGWWSGGTETFLRLARLIGEHRPIEIVVYASAEADYRSLDAALRDDESDQHVWVFTTGVDVAGLAARLAGRRMVYCAQEAGWRLDLPVGVPILCTSRVVMAYVSERLEGHPTFFLPNALAPDVQDSGLERDIDVLHLTRKATSYLRDELVPALATKCRVETVDRFLPRQELLQRFNRSKVYLYDSSSSFADGIVEGFGLQPLEALVCGCAVVSNLSGGMSDYLEPGVNCHRLSLVLREDIDLCLGAVGGWSPTGSNKDELRSRYSEDALRGRLARVLAAVESASFPRSQADTNEIAQHLVSARTEANQPLYAEIRQQRLLISSLQTEMETKIGERDVTIRNLQAELHEKVGQRDEVIRSLQAELLSKVSDGDRAIRALQSELSEKVGQRDEVIRSLQAELHLRREQAEDIQALRLELESRIATQDAGIRALRLELDSMYRSRSWRLTAPLRVIARRLRRQ
jgi:hypothetical protein